MKIEMVILTIGLTIELWWVFLPMKKIKNKNKNNNYINNHLINNVEVIMK